MRHILCFDDSIVQLSAHLAYLKQELDARIYPADTLQSAQALLMEHTIDLFILDIEITGERTTGIQLAQEIRCMPQYACTPILFISMYSHYSRHLLSAISHCAFVSKPFSPTTLTETAGSLLGIARYIDRSYKKAILTVPTKQGSVVEIDARRVSYLELMRSELIVQYIDGERLCFHVAHGCLKALLSQLESNGMTHLRQVYRSIIINVEQIKQIELDKNVGTVWLFGDDEPKPIGIRFRETLAEFL